MKSRAALLTRIEKPGTVFHGIRIGAGSHLCVHAFVNATAKSDGSEYSCAGRAATEELIGDKEAAAPIIRSTPVNLGEHEGRFISR